jgi:hypothetical protein
MIWALGAAGLLAASVQAAPARPGDPAAVVAAERAFAARAAEVGIGPSFLEYMTDDAIVFSPDPLLAKAVYGVMPPPKLPKDGGTRLNWWPNFAGVARSGDLAFTTGPATVNGGKPGIFYFTVWSRHGSGSTTAASTPMARARPARRPPRLPCHPATPSHSPPTWPWTRCAPPRSRWPPAPRPIRPRPTRPC